MAENAAARSDLDPSGRHRARSGRPAGAARRRDRSDLGIRIVSVVGLGVGLIVLAIGFGGDTLRPFIFDSGPEPQVGVPVAVASPPPLRQPAPADVPGPTPTAGPASGTPDPSSPATPTPTPSVTPSTSTSPSAAAVPTPSATPSSPVVNPPPVADVPPPPPLPPPQPVLLGPGGRGELTQLVERYCDRRVGSLSWADARGDGRWECGQLLSSRIVDMDVACRDTYGDGAFARNTEPGDAYGWRCFRN
ncbi:hypothetical protein [Plantactinospora sp. CA-290183]|uniref:hypothetical protein n=1 Tax=Plantactinospora sp. CA-290183 TaxID=3240006 RepID=UPI003D905839